MHASHLKQHFCSCSRFADISRRDNIRPSNLNIHPRLHSRILVQGRHSKLVQRRGDVACLAIRRLGPRARVPNCQSCAAWMVQPHEPLPELSAGMSGDFWPVQKAGRVNRPAHPEKLSGQSRALQHVSGHFCLGAGQPWQTLKPSTIPHRAQSL